MLYEKIKITIKREEVSPLGSSPWRKEVVGSAEGINSIFYAFGSIPGPAFARKSRYVIHVDGCMCEVTKIKRQTSNPM